MTRSTRNRLIALAVVLAVLAAPLLIPLNAYRAPIERAASQALSREVHIQGPIRLSVYPNIGLSLAEVSVANAPGAQHADMVTIGNLVVGARIGPLFSGRLEVTELILQKPAIHLEVRDGEPPNWGFGRDTSAGRPADVMALHRIGLSRMRIQDGTVTYHDAVSGKNAVFTDVALSLDMPLWGRPTLARPLVVNGWVVYNGQRLRVAGRLDNFAALLSNRRSGGRIGIASNVINADFTGTIGTDGVSGALKLGAHSVRSLAAWLGKPLPPGNGLGLIALDGQFTARDGVYSLRQTHLAFDSMIVNGDVVLDTNPEVLTLKGHATVNRLDLTPYLAPGATTDTVQAARARAAAPNAPLSLNGLKAMDADVTLVLGGLVLPNLKLDQAVARATLEKGVLNAEMTNVKAYGGTGKATLNVDTRGAEPSFRHALDMSAINVQPFLAQLIGVETITGTGNVRFELASRGATPEAVVSGLQGRGEIQFTEGAIRGANLAAIGRVLNSVLDGQLPADVLGNEASTRFARMGASFVVRDGVVRSDNIRLSGPGLQASGRGEVDLPNQALEFHLVPRPGIPFFVKGPWQDPGFGPDVRGLMNNVGQALRNSAGSPIEAITRRGLSLDSILGSE